LIRKKALASPDLFIHAVPHMSFVHGAAHVAYLKRRYAALTAHHLYRGMEFTEDKQTFRDWFPLVMEGRPDSDIIAATRMITGADVNYGALTRSLIGYLQTLSGFAIHYSRRVTGLNREDGGRWRIETIDAASNAQTSTTTKFVFLGAGGGALPLLQKSGIPEANGYAGFPVSGIGCAAMTRRSTNGITPKSTAWPMSVRRRCPFRTSIPGSSATPVRSCSGPMPGSPPSS
jgi:malate dehydrogenase (quinone)